MNKFPILGSEPKEYIPLDIIKQHEKQALRNHGQSLKRLAERGGLGWIEALCVLENREYDFHTKLTEEIAKIKVLEIIKKKDGVGMRRFKVVCDHCEGTGKNGDCDWCMGSGYKIVVSKDGREPLGAIEEIPFGKSEVNSNEL